MKGKRILLAVCGSIALYKSLELVRLLKKAGADVQIVLTASAKKFVTPLSFATLSGRPALSSFVAEETQDWNNHVALALWADFMVIAPLSANTLAKLVAGACDNLLLAVYLSARCPMMVAPAMDVDMYHHAATQRNLNLLKEAGVYVLESPTGPLASGLEGAGRMVEPEDLFERMRHHVCFSSCFAKKKVLITAGPTWEKIDDVRFISNASSGRMGYALAEAFAVCGAEVSLVAGPTNLRARHPRVQEILVQTAEDMHEACVERHKACGIAVFVAAVGDFRVKNYAPGKIKKNKDIDLRLSLEENVDIAKSLGKAKGDRFHVGFALESTHDTAEAKRKLVEKNLDLVVLNESAAPDAGFMASTNRVTLISADEKEQRLGLKAKREVAYDIVHCVYQKAYAAASIRL